MKTTGEMIRYVYSKLGEEEAKRRIESVRIADQVRQAVAIEIVYKSLWGSNR